MDWKEFRFVRKGKADLLWKIAQDGDRYHTEHGQVDGAMQENSDSPGSKGKEGTLAYVTPEDNCTFHVNREIRKKTENGYIEYVNGLPTEEQINKISFDQYLPKAFCGYKPQTSITDKALETLHEKKLARYSRKYDGMCHLCVHHTWGWEIYSRRIDLTSDRFPNHIKQLEKMTMYGVGTILVGEMVCFKKDGTDDFKAISRICRSKPDEARELVMNGEVHDPMFVVFDILFHNKKNLNDMSYDDRSSKFTNLLSLQQILNGELIKNKMFVECDTLISHVDYFKVTPKTWEDFAKKNGWEGFVVTDGSAKPGDKFYSFNGKANRPKGHHKLKPLFDEDVVIYAGASGTGKRADGVGSVYVKQKHPDTGLWFSCGKVGSGFTDEDLVEVETLIKKHGLPIVDKEKELADVNLADGHGIVMVLEYSDRQPGTNKFRFPVFCRVRFDKAVDECEAQKLAPEEEE